MLVVWKLVSDPLINITKSHLPGWRAGNGRCDEVRIAEWRFGVDATCRLAAAVIIIALVGRSPRYDRSAAADKTS